MEKSQEEQLRGDAPERVIPSRSSRRADRKAAKRQRSKNKNVNDPKEKGGSNQPSLLMDLEFLLLKIGFIAIVLVLLFTLLFGIVQVPDNTMKPAIKEGDLTIFYRLQKNYAAGDVITVEYQDDLQVRRVVAVAGDTVDITSDGHLKINGYSQIEDNIYVETLPYKQGIKFPVTVKKGQVFVLADDRNTPIDSRLYGPVDISATHGKIMTIIRRRGI